VESHLLEMIKMDGFAKILLSLSLIGDAKTMHSIDIELELKATPKETLDVLNLSMKFTN